MTMVVSLTTALAITFRSTMTGVRDRGRAVTRSRIQHRVRVHSLPRRRSWPACRAPGHTQWPGRGPSRRRSCLLGLLRCARNASRRSRSRCPGLGRRSAAAQTPPVPAAGGEAPLAAGCLRPTRRALRPVTPSAAPQQWSARGAASPTGPRLRVDPVDERGQSLPERAAGRSLQDAATLEQAGVRGCPVIGQQDDVLHPAETSQRLTQGLLRGGTGGRGPHPIEDDLDPSRGHHGGAHLIQELKQASNPDRIRPAHHHDDIGTSHQVGGDRPAPGLEREIVDVVVDDATGDVDDGPGRAPAALEPDLGHGGRRQLAPAAGPPQSSQQREPTTHRGQEPLEALGIEPSVGGQARAEESSGMPRS